MNTRFSLILFAILSLSSQAQNLLPEPNSSGPALDYASRLRQVDKPQLLQLQFPVNPEELLGLEKAGVALLHHYGQGLYLVDRLPENYAALGLPILAIDKLPADLATTRRFALSEFEELNLQGTEEMQLRSGQNQQHSTTTDKVVLLLAYPGAEKNLRAELARAGFQADPVQMQDGVSLSGQIRREGLSLLAGNPLILDVTPHQGEAIPYNMEARVGHGVSVLNSGIPGAPQLNGEGTVIGVGDGGYLSGHADIGDRVVHSTTFYNSGWGSHPDMVSGIVGSAGNVNPNHRGTAPEAELVIEATSMITFFAPTYYTQYGMTVTNNSYGPSFHCTTAGRYFSPAASIDEQLMLNPKLSHVFAAGNSGAHTCSPVPTGYTTMPASEAMAKNTISVANARPDLSLFASSSAGPAFDGRLKPDLTAIGSSITSNNRTGSYSTGSGTSYAAPGVAATLALLTQHYQTMNPGQLPDGALLKAVLCNTANDQGNPGPDFRYGYGIMNSRRALEVLSQASHHQGTLSPGSSYSRTLHVAANSEQLRVMLYWHDPKGATTNTAPVLVNNFDLFLINPSGDTIRPWILDPTQPANHAQRGIDNLNNIEQVTLEAPAAGTYTLVVQAKNLPLGSASYVLTWFSPQPEVILTCPFGGESIIPGTATYIGWDASPGQSGTWRVEYSLNSGAWNTIQAGIPAATRAIVWNAPLTPGQLAVRVTNESSGLSDATDAPVTALGSPTNFDAFPTCNGNMLLRWSPVPSANGYEVFRFDGAEMVSAGVVSDTQAVVSNLVIGEQTLFSVRALTGTESQHKGQRAYAIAKEASLNGIGCQQPLPVTWTSISTRDADGAIEVLWSVAAEYNNEYFQVERGRPYGDTLSWDIVGRVAGRGTDYSPAHFSMEDLDAPLAEVLYYRIRQVDYDGLSAFSSTVAHRRFVHADAEPEMVSLLQNPIAEGLRLDVHAEGMTALQLFDTAGRLRKTYQAREGRNDLEWPAELPTGIYMLRVQSGEKIQTLRLLKS